jgi:uroporphyrinogen III methyltransferase/synthase
MAICRKSRLAEAQLNEVYDQVPYMGYREIEVDSYGDLHREISLWEGSLPADFFTRELDERCLVEPDSIAVHSAKDMPFPVTDGLEIYALTEGRSNTDSLVTRHGETLAELPAGSRVATSSPNRRRQLLELRPDLQAVSIRGNIDERIAKVDSGEVDALIVATCALERLDLMDRQAEELPFKTHPLQGKLAVVGAKGGSLKEEFELIDVRRKYGRLTIVGAGPGNVGSLTLDGAEALKRAQVVFYDDLIGEDLVERFRRERAEWIYVGKRCGAHSFEQEEINEMLLQKVLEGRRVVRLKGGDPMVFAHVREEIDYVQMGTLMEVQVVPGVTAGIAAAALSQTPLTQRGVASSVAFALGHGSELQTPNTDTVVYYMCGNNIARIAAALLQSGRAATTPVVLGCDVTRPGQVFIHAQLGDLQHAAMKNTVPIIMIVGAAAACDEHVLKFQRTLHTESTPPRRSPDALPDPYNTYEPLIQRSPVFNLKRFAPGGSLAPERFDWVVFTSSYTVTCYDIAFFKSPTPMKRAFAGVKVASVGPTTTSALKEDGIEVTMESPTCSAAGIVEYFRREVKQPQRILLPHSDLALSELEDGLKALGHDVTPVVVYMTEHYSQARKVDLAEYKRIYFASPSGVDAFIRLYGALPEGKLLLAKGDTTLDKIIKELQH